MYTNCEYNGCSTQSVPSWSNVAIRSGTGTNLGLPGVVVDLTNSTMALFAALSCQDGRGSDCAEAVVLRTNTAALAAQSQEAFIEKTPVRQVEQEIVADEERLMVTLLEPRRLERRRPDMGPLREGVRTRRPAVKVFRAQVPGLHPGHQ
jgi:hypothetical protein